MQVRLREAAIKLTELIEGLDVIEIKGKTDIEIENIEYDSRLTKKNSLFFAVTGFKQDGYQFVQQAVSNGTVAVVGEKEKCEGVGTYIRVPDIRLAMAHIAVVFYGYPGKKMKLCGVTGTNGKTTVCHLLRNILEQQNKKTGLLCSTIYDTGKEVFTAERTTPEAIDIQRLLFLMKKNYCTNAVIEVSSHALALKRVEFLKFRVVVFTNITRDHLDFHKTMEDYLNTKALLLKKMNGPMSYAVINLDIPEFRKFFGDFSSSYLSYSLEDSNADVYCANYEIKPTSTVFDLVTPMGTQTVMLPLPGRFNLINAVAAATAGLAYGIDFDNVIAGLETARPVPGRFMPVDVGQPFGVYIDFAHTPDALERLCQSAREMTKGKVMILFGCGGDRDKGKRPIMGEVATKNADYVVVTSDNPRSESPDVIIKDIKPGLKKKNYKIIPDRKEAIAHIINEATTGDVVLLAGKGIENYQEINGERFPFNDSAQAREALVERGFVPANVVEES